MFPFDYRRLSRTVMIAAAVAMACAAPAYALKNLIIMNDNGVEASNDRFSLRSVKPHENQTLDASPQDITLKFSQAVVADRSSIKLVDSYGNTVEQGQLEGDGKSLQLPISGDLGSGRYTVRWRARCQCNDDTELSGSYHFTIQ